MKTSIFLTAALAILLTASVGCSDSQTSPKQDDTEDTAPVTETAANQLAAADFVPDDISFNGETFTVIQGNGWGYTGEGWKGSSMDEVAPIPEEVAVGDIINESVVERNRLTEEKLNIKIRSIEAPSGCFGFNTDIQNSVMAGDNAYDAVCGTVSTIYNCAVSGLLTNLADIKTLDLSHSWWDQKTRRMFNFGTDSEILYFANGDINYLDNYASQMLFVNKSLLASLDMEAPYDLVREHKWTFDAMMEMYKNAYTDLNADNKPSMEDRYGFISNIGVMTRLLPACDMEFFVKQDDGTYTINDSERYVTALEKVFNAMTMSPDVYLTGGGEYSEIFRAGRSIFSDDYLWAIRSIAKELEDDYGVVPFPLYDETQTQYLAPVNDMYASAYGVIVTTDYERAGYILDVMGAFSVDTVTDAVIETTCKIKDVRDEDTVDMLEIIFDGAMYPLDTITRWGDSQGFFLDLMSKKKNNFASSITKMQKRVAKDAASDLEALANPN